MTKLPNISDFTEEEINNSEFDQYNYPTVSEIINAPENKGLIKWRKEVGEDVADYIMKQGGQRGSDVHEIIQDYLTLKPRLDGSEEWHKHKVSSVLAHGLFHLMKNYIDNITDVWGVEKKLISHKYKMRGRADCIAHWNGQNTIIDFKTGRGHIEKPPESAMIQCCAYAIMLEEHYGYKCEQLLVIHASENGSSHAFLRRTNDYVKKLENCIKIYNEIKEQKNEQETN